MKNLSENTLLTNRTMRMALVFVIMSFVATGCKQEQRQQKTAAELDFAVEEHFERGPLTVTVRLEKDEITIADTIWVEFEAVIDEGYEVELPSMAAFMAGEESWGVLDYRTLPEKLLPGDKIRYRKRARLEPIVSGTYNIPALPIIFYKKDQAKQAEDPCLPPAFGARPEETFELISEAMPVKVNSLVDEDHADLEISGIRDVAQPRRESDRQWYLLLLIPAGLLMAAMAFFLIHKNRGRKEIKIMLAAHELAYERLRRLSAENLIDEGRTREFFERISNILRWYIEHRFRLRAPERTTEEFLGEIRQTDILTREQQQMLEEFLTLCDKVKFGLYGPTVKEIQRTFDLTKNFIEATKIAEKQVDVTGQVQESQPATARSA